MNPFDQIIVASALISLILFIILQILIFRFVHPEAVLKWIMNTFYMASVVHCVGVYYFLFCLPNFLERGLVFEAVWITALSYIVFGLMAFVYVLCMFGPSETSIRVRVVRELRDSPKQRLSSEELFKRYNGKMVLERRLERFLCSGEIIKQGGKYELVKKANAFFIIDAVARRLQKVLGNPS